ncbi:hypothetical protein LCGC14_1985890 [marine sediment metagenome]|uniref:Uncharacterized protein n=1 Tax=marine sediment metagenome TaxID=412755 RepID=A0A0F9FVL7_9ZZZZ
MEKLPKVTFITQADGFLGLRQRKTVYITMKVPKHLESAIDDLIGNDIIAFQNRTGMYQPWD